MSSFRIIVLSKSDCAKSTRSRRELRPEEFATRRKARRWAANHFFGLADGLLIVHPDGTEETFKWAGLTHRKLTAPLL